MMSRRSRSSPSDVGVVTPGENKWIKEVEKSRRSNSGGWRIGKVKKAVGKSIQKINLGRMIDQMEDSQVLADQLEAVNAENYDEITFREIKREAEVACMLEVRGHLEEFVVEHPEATYEQWIMELHPDNINERVPHTIDHRFYVEDSDHRRLWNINLTRGGGRRSYVHALSGDDLPIHNNHKKVAKHEPKPKNIHEANLRIDFDQYPQRHVYDDKELDVDVSDPMGSHELIPQPDPPHRFGQNSRRVQRSLDFDSHLFQTPSHLTNPAPTTNDRSQSPPPHEHTHTEPSPPQLTPEPHNRSRADSYHEDHQPDPYKDLGFDCDDEDLDEPLITHQQPQLTPLEPNNNNNNNNSPYHDDHQPDPYQDLGFDRDDVDDDNYDEPHLFPPTTAHLTNPTTPTTKDQSPSPPPTQQQKTSSPQATSPARTKHHHTPKSLNSPGGTPRFDTVETRLHLENHLSKNPQCKYEHWIGGLYPHLVSRDLSTGDVLILGEEECFYAEGSEFRRLWNVYLARGGGRRCYVSARKF